jgi:HEAT repeat protein
VLVLADHAVGGGGRSGLQARVAQRLCTELAAGRRLDALIERAGSSDTRARVRATQVLLQLGEAAIPALFDRIAVARSPEGAAQLTATLIALGDAAVPHLSRMITSPDAARAGLAVRLAAEIQHPALARPLARALLGDRDTLRREAARSLAHLGGDEAVHALINALTGDDAALCAVAVHWLGELRDPRAVQPLLAALERAMRAGDTARAGEIVRALGTLGSERATPRLVALVERRSWLRRRALRALQIAALTALHGLPGREARRAIDRARRHRDPAVRARAMELLSPAPAPEAPSAAP